MTAPSRLNPQPNPMSTLLRSFAFLVLAVGAVAALGNALAATPGAALPTVLFFANPMTSDNDVIRRPASGELSVAERHFAALCRGVFDVTITQDGTEVVKEKLSRYRAIVFFTAINPPGVDRDALIAWVAGGGAFVGIHSTANTFQGATHPATRHLAATFPFADDIYQFKNFDRPQVQLLLSLDPAGLDLANPKVNPADRVFPVSWAKPHGEGRVFYTALGDWEETWSDPRYRTHLTQGILWAMKLADAKP